MLLWLLRKFHPTYEHPTSTKISSHVGVDLCELHQFIGLQNANQLYAHDRRFVMMPSAILSMLVTSLFF